MRTYETATLQANPTGSSTSGEGVPLSLHVEYTPLFEDPPPQYETLIGFGTRPPPVPCTAIGVYSRCTCLSWKLLPKWLFSGGWVSRGIQGYPPPMYGNTQQNSLCQCDGN